MNQSIVKKLQMEYFSLVILFLSCIIFRIQVGDIGIGYLLTTYLFYELLWVIFGKNVSDTVGRIIRVKYQKGKTKSARLVWKYSFAMQFVTGLIVGVALAIGGAGIISKGLGFTHSYFLIWVMGPIFFIRMVSESYAGYLSGKSYEMAAGFSSIIRYTIVLVMGVMLSSAVKEYGKKVAALLKQEDFASVYGNLGILISAVVAEIVVLVFLMIIRLAVKRKSSEYEDDYYQRNDNNGNVLTIVWKRRFVEGINLIVMFSPIVILYMSLKKQYDTGLAFASDLGLMVGTIAAPCALFIMMGFLVSFPLGIKTVRFVKRKEMRQARISFQAGFHICVMYGVFGAALLLGEGTIFSSMLTEEYAAQINSLYTYAAFIIITATLAFYMLRVLIMNGQALLGLVVEVISTVIFGVLLNVFIKGSMSVMMAVMISVLAYFVIQTLAYTALVIVRLDMQIDPLNSFFIPAFVGAICCALNLLLSRLISPHLGNIFTLIFCSIEMLVVYVLILLLFRNFKDYELEYIPGNKLIYALGQMLHVL